MARDHQGAAAVPPPAGQRRGGPRRAGARAVQARADRRQGLGRRRRRSQRRGRRGRADHLRQPAPRRLDRLEGPVPRPARAAHRLHPGVRADPQLRRVLARATRRTPRCSGSTAPPGRARRPSRRTRPGWRRRRSATTASSGRELDLFSFPEVLGSGLAVFHPKGGIIRREMENYARQRHIDEGFEFVNTPHITKSPLFETSGHLPYFADTMFPPMAMEGADYYLKAMNCPMHNLIYASRGRSYRELPLRLFEFGSVYRFEKSGVVHGLTRVRGHDPGRLALLLHRPSRRRTRSRSCCPSSSACSATTAWTTSTSSCPPGTTPEKFIGSERGVGDGDRGAGGGRGRVRAAARARPGRRGVLRPEDLGPGPRRDRPDLAAGRPSSTTSTSRRGSSLEYTAADGSRQQPVMIHSAKFGSIERFLGVLTEHYAGAFPPWLAPVQVVAVPGGRRVRGLPDRGGGPAARRPAYGSRWTPATTGWARRSATPSSRRCPTS